MTTSGSCLVGAFLASWNQHAEMPLRTHSLKWLARFDRYSIPLPKFNTSIVFHILTMVSIVPSLVFSSYGLSPPFLITEDTGLLRGHEIIFDVGGEPNWPLNSTDLVWLILNRFATIIRISRMESVIRKGWGLPWPRGWDTPRMPDGEVSIETLSVWCVCVCVCVFSHQQTFSAPASLAYFSRPLITEVINKILPQDEKLRIQGGAELHV